MSALQQETAVLELWELLTRCLGKPELATRILARFDRQLADDLERIEAALADGKTEIAREVAHRLKGAAANVAAHALREQAHALETAIQLGLAEQYPLVLRGLVAERDRFTEILKQVRFE